MKNKDKKLLPRALKMVLAETADKQKYGELFREFSVKKKYRSYATVIACALVKKAGAGDVSAASYIRDTAGERLTAEDTAAEQVIIIEDLGGKADED